MSIRDYRRLLGGVVVSTAIGLMNLTVSGCGEQTDDSSPQSQPADSGGDSGGSGSRDGSDSR